MFTEHERTITIALPHLDGLNVIIEIRRGQQEPPHTSDLIVALATVHLPIDPEPGWQEVELHRDLRFDRRVLLAGDPLYTDWGKIDAVNGTPTRMRRHRFQGTRWARAFADAEHWAREEIGKVVDALEARHRAYVDAEQDA